MGKITGFITSLILAFVIFATNGNHVLAQRTFAHIGSQQNIMEEILNPNYYNKKIAPFNTNNGSVSQATVVTVNMYVRSIDSVDDIKREFNIQTTFTMAWNDQRLNYMDKTERVNVPFISFINGNDNEVDIWIPDVIFENEKSGRLNSLLAPNTVVRIYPSGDVVYSARLSLTLRCPMDLKLYPFDTQNCSIRFSTYASTMDNLILLWKSVDPILITSEIELPVFQLARFTTTYCGSQGETGGTHSCLNADFTLRRRINYYLVNVYIPCTMCVVLTWLTMFLHHQDTSGLTRIALQVITLLLLANQIGRLNEFNPIVSYTKAIDCWTGMSLTFIMIAVIESIIAHYITKRGKNSQLNEVTPKTTCLNRWNQFTAGGKLDLIMRIIFPIVFLLYGILYFACYCMKAKAAM